ncbi:hypothetical protein F2Q70_00013329 [Brassica cretica]|uniref:Uncharacterized protein n=1 Tax=Brassica cretica TaxID=69181 RepID=A0A8S9M4Z3_BRACR|nr:hypothetical protein F2Q70_00013329 [Brassica cretica]
MTHEEFTAKHPHPPSHVYVKIDRHSDPSSINIRRPPSIDNIQHPAIDEHLLQAARTPSEDETDPMEVDRVPTGRTLRKRKEKVEKHLKRGANE